MRIYLDVPDNEKNEAEKLGAEFDPDNEKWFYDYPNVKNEYQKFAKWLFKDMIKAKAMWDTILQYHWNKQYVCDSIGEHYLDDILTKMLKNYDLEKNYGIRVIIQQPLSNYVQNLSSEDYGYFMAKYLNNKNQWTKFDFLIEARQRHVPLLVIELDGPNHRGDNNEAKTQEERDKYKDSVCSALNIPIYRIPYDDILEITEKEIQDKHQDEIIRRIFYSIIKEGIETVDELRSKYPQKTQLINEAEQWLCNVKTDPPS